MICEQPVALSCFSRDLSSLDKYADEVEFNIQESHRLCEKLLTCQETYLQSSKIESISLSNVLKTSSQECRMTKQVEFLSELSRAFCLKSPVSSPTYQGPSAVVERKKKKKKEETIFSIYWCDCCGWQSRKQLEWLLRHTCADIVQWLMKNLSIEDPGEAIHLGSLIAAQGYVFPISDHVLTLKDDGTFYRFQENLARLQRAFARKWEFIFMQAEAQVKIDRKKDKTERKILDSQERAFWDVHRPVPGCVNTTEMDIRKCRRMKNPQKVKKSVYGVTEESQPQSPVHMPSQPVRKTTKEDFRKQITFLNLQIDRHCLKMSKVAESLIAYTEQYVEYDPFITPAEPSNPWISDDAALWDIEMSKEPSQQRVKRWGFSMDEVLKDPVGRDQFLRFLESEFSSENLRFWLAVQDLKKQPLQDVTTRVEEIWQEFLAPGAQSAINLDSHSYEKTSQNVKDPGRYTYEDAQEHIYKLMKSDSYARFLRSNAYQDLLLAKKKPENEQGRRTSLEKFTRSVVSSFSFPSSLSSELHFSLGGMWTLNLLHLLFLQIASLQLLF
ncbi:regulator of G-protein signaling 6 isoform X3 [Anser cygnoides]|uniref:regulator of G-protein signaling 6 isoform X3 n=1 Tax=Anser cygnoides TaxID=8845 RepID=UPI0034D1769A